MGENNKSKNKIIIICIVVVISLAMIGLGLSIYWNSKNKSKDLFTSKVVAKEYILPHTPTDKLESLNTTLMYSGVCLLVFGGACYATYRMNKE